MCNRHGSRLVESKDALLPMVAANQPQQSMLAQPLHACARLSMPSCRRAICSTPAPGPAAAQIPSHTPHAVAAASPSQHGFLHVHSELMKAAPAASRAPRPPRAARARPARRRGRSPACLHKSAGLLANIKCNLKIKYTSVAHRQQKREPHFKKQFCHWKEVDMTSALSWCACH